MLQLNYNSWTSPQENLNDQMKLFTIVHDKGCVWGEWGLGGDVPINIFLFHNENIYMYSIVGTHQQCLSEVLLMMSTNVFM